MAAAITLVAGVAFVSRVAPEVLATAESFRSNRLSYPPLYRCRSRASGKTDGVAGNSGRQRRPAAKAPDRGDCPNPPGQNK